MRIYEPVSQFGWEGDGGLGAALIAKILRGEKTATCCPRALYREDELAAVRATAGRLVTVVDKDGHPRCNIRIIEVFETPFGAPDPRLVAGEGFADDAAFQAAHAHAWDDLLAQQGLLLSADTVLVVELFALAAAEPPGDS
jgi:uncharacterized protein YhfF